MFIIYSKCNQPQNTPQRQRPTGAFLFQAHFKWRGGGGIIWDGWLTLFRKDDGINILNKK